MGLPVYSLKSISDTRVKLANKLELDFYACSPTGSSFHSLVTLLIENLSKDIPRHTMETSVRHLAGTFIDDDVIWELTWRLAGNLNKLKKGKVISPWTHQREKEWVPVEVRSIDPGSRDVKVKNSDEKIGRNLKSRETVRRRGGLFRLLALAGSPAGQRFECFWSLRYLHRYKSELSFSKFDREAFTHKVPKNPSHPLRDVMQLTRMRMFAQVEPNLPLQPIIISELKGSSGCRTWNRDLLLKRLRKGYECPMKYTLPMSPCHSCEVGYDRCLAGCHPRSYVPALCSKCNQQSWFDPKFPEQCVNCSAKPSNPEAK